MSGETEVGGEPTGSRVGEDPGRGHRRRLSITQNASLLATATLGARILTFALALALARGLGPHEYGLYTFAAAIFTVANPIAELGLIPYVTREAARDRARLDAAVGRLFWLRAGTAGLGMVVAIGWVATDPGSSLARAFAIVWLGMSLEAIAFLGYAYLQGLERMHYQAVTTLVAALAKTVGGIALVLLGAPLEIVLVWMAVVAGLQLLAVGILVRRERLASLWASARARPLRLILRSALAMMLVMVADAVILRADSIVIGAVDGATDVGIYTAAYTLVTGAEVVPFVLQLAVYPVFARTVRQDPPTFAATFDRSFRAALLLTLPVALITSVLGEQIMELVYGAEYASAGSALAVLMWWVPVAGASLLVQGILPSVDREWAMAAVLVVGAVVNVVGNLVAVPLAGLVGAASVTLGVGVAILAAMWLVAHRSGVRRPAAGFLVRAIPGCVALVVVGVALRPTSTVLAIVAGLAAYVIGLAALRVVSREDASLLLRALRSRGAA